MRRKKKIRTKHSLEFLETQIFMGKMYEKGTIIEVDKNTKDRYSKSDRYKKLFKFN